MSGQALDAFRRLGLRAPGGPPPLCAVHRPEASAGYEAACLTQALNSDVRGRTIAFLGGAFKAGTSDDRDSPALRLADRLHQLGAIVRLFDPEAQDNARRTHPPPRLRRQRP
ncbi:UDP binding domain-containing protein [Kitasatospora aureofaciens]|uniref:UDP binding domain-containing protein n=1 Tax=Kitasatospora aureofaciens TaxID=1894 RepID=UPI0034005F04